MTRGQRVALWSTTLTVVYMLAFFSYIPVPLVSVEQSDQIIPVVRLVHLIFYVVISDSLANSCPGGSLYLLDLTPCGQWERAYLPSANVPMPTRHSSKYVLYPTLLNRANAMGTGDIAGKGRTTEQGCNS